MNQEEDRTIAHSSIVLHGGWCISFSFFVRWNDRG